MAMKLTAMCLTLRILPVFILSLFATRTFAMSEEQVPILAADADLSTQYGTPPFSTPDMLSSTRKPSLADLLTIEPSVSIFYTYAREIGLSKVFGDLTSNVTVLAPTNKAVMALSWKPQKGPRNDDTMIGITESEFDRRSKRNVERWISAHIIPLSPIALPSQTYPTLRKGKSITFHPIAKSDNNGPEWSRVTLEDGVRILKATEGANGVLYLIDGTVSWD